MYAFNLGLCIYTDLDIIVEDVKNVNIIIVFSFVTSTLYTLYLMATNKNEENSFIDMIYNKLYLIFINPRIAILIFCVSIFISFNIKTEYFNMLQYSDISIFTYVVLTIPLWLPITYIIHIALQIVICYVHYGLINVNVLELPINFLFTPVKNSINHKNCLIIIACIYFMWFAKILCLTYIQFDNYMSKSCVMYSLDPNKT